MRFTYDADADAVYFYVASEIPPGGVAKTHSCDPCEVGGMINLDFDSAGHLVGIEVMDASALLPPEILSIGESRSDEWDG